MIFHENRLLADDSHEISFLISFEIRKMSQNLLSAAVVIGALRVKYIKQGANMKSLENDKFTWAIPVRLGIFFLLSKFSSAQQVCHKNDADQSGLADTINS